MPIWVIFREMAYLPYERIPGHSQPLGSPDGMAPWIGGIVPCPYLGMGGYGYPSARSVLTTQGSSIGVPVNSI